VLDKKALLATHYLFRDLDPGVVGRIAELGITRRLTPDEVLFLKGDEGDALYGVLSGRIKISTAAPGGKEIILNVIHPGDVFGEIALLDGGPRSADASAMSDVALMAIQRRDFVRLMEREPKLSTHLLRLVCARVRATSEMIEDAAFLSLPSRLAKRLLALADLQGSTVKDGIDLAISQSNLAQIMGTSRESINKHLQGWRQAGWIVIGRARLTITERQALQELVDSGMDD
jgi:CRP/FNR family transcriptional regulator, cyclic AMP receptor protein